MAVRRSEYMRAIRRRRDHLANRIARANGRDLSWDKRERNALVWAIRELVRAYPESADPGDAAHDLTRFESVVEKR